KMRSFVFVIVIILGLILYTVIFRVGSNTFGEAAPFSFFPLGSLTWDTGVVLTAVLAGILNTSNTFGALKGTDELFESDTTNKDYMTTFSITELSTMIAGVFELVAYAPYVSRSEERRVGKECGIRVWRLSS